MKCQHCGVNFDDDDRYCPICGAKAGSRGRMSEQKQAPSPIRWMEHMQQTPHTKHDHPAKANARRSTASAQPIRDAYSSARPTQPGANQRAKGASKKAIIVAVVVFLLVNFLPLLFTLVGGIFGSVGSAIPDFGDLAEDWAEDSGYADYYDDDDRTLGEAIGDEPLTLDAAGGTLMLRATGDDSYELTWNSADGADYYDEQGYVWCSYSDDENGYRLSEFPIDRYDQYFITLTADAIEHTENIPQWCTDRATGESTDSLWLVAYVDRDTGDVAIEDMDVLGLFGDMEYSMTAYYDSL